MYNITSEQLWLSSLENSAPYSAVLLQDKNMFSKCEIVVSKMGGGAPLGGMVLSRRIELIWEFQVCYELVVLKKEH